MVFGVARLIEYITAVHDAAPRRRAAHRHARGGRQARDRRRGRGRGRGRGHAPEPGGGERDAGPLPFRAGTVRLAARRERPQRPVLVAARPRTTGGAFILRVEDTDASRVTEEAVPGRARRPALAGDRLGRGPGGRRSSRSLPSVRARRDLPRAGRRLARQGDAYPCYCTADELEERRRRRSLAGGRPATTDAAGPRPPTRGPPSKPRVARRSLRFRMPDREWVVHDLVKGEVRWAAGATAGLRDRCAPTARPVFLLAVAVDDMLMGVTHVVRGDDLLASAPRNAARHRSAGRHAAGLRTPPAGAGPRRKPLSKRHGSTSVAGVPRAGLSCPRRS